MSTALVLPLIAAMEEAKSESLAESKWAFGIFAFVVLAGLLVITLIFGKGRPHS
ncbi:MAG TPA: hypothetical protein VEK80_03920 [Kribbellaceae bacterium]|jgi:hypothetical protein|nr:hypothetical protein [Kribbellaceae bacterium]